VGDEIQPATHSLFFWRPFIFDERKLGKTFRGFEIKTVIIDETIPQEFRLDEEGILPFDICWSEEKIIVYAEKHALEICEQLNDYKLTLKDISDIIAGGDFEQHKKLLHEERLERLSEEEE